MTVRLTPAQREVWDLYRRGYGTRAIAQILGIHRSSVRDRLASAKDKMKERRAAA